MFTIDSVIKLTDDSVGELTGQLLQRLASWGSEPGFLAQDYGALIWRKVVFVVLKDGDVEDRGQAVVELPRSYLLFGSAGRSRAGPSPW